MKVYVLGSTTFQREMVKATNDLKSLKVDAWVHPDYVKYVQGKHPDLRRHERGERSQIKIDNNYFKVHYQNILKSDAILIINLTKNSIDNYIGGNALIEMGQAYVNDKLIFLYNNIPSELSYTDEVIAMQPICLDGDLTKIKSY